MDCEYATKAVGCTNGLGSVEKAATYGMALPQAVGPGTRLGDWARGIGKAPCNLEALTATQRFLDRGGSRLMVCGPQGSGKTLLLHCIQAALVSHSRRKSVRMYRADQWLLQRQPVKNVRSLLVDDVHAILAARPAAEALAEAVRLVVEQGGQVVLSCLKPPTGRERQRYGFGGEGWEYAVLHQPGFADRVALMSQMAQQCGLQLNEEAVRLIGERVRGGLHGLQGALHRLLVLRDHGGQAALSPARVASLLGPLECGGAYAELPEAVNAVLAKFGVESEEAPSWAAFLLTRYAGVTEATAADWLGVSRSRVHHGARQIEALADLDPTVKSTVRTLTAALDAQLLGNEGPLPC